jgi:hypothetical protein
MHVGASGKEAGSRRPITSSSSYDKRGRNNDNIVCILLVVCILLSVSMQVYMHAACPTQRALRSRVAHNNDICWAGLVATYCP